MLNRHSLSRAMHMQSTWPIVSLCSHNTGSIWSVSETRSAHYRSALSRLEWDCCAAPAFSAYDMRFNSTPTFPLGFALLAVFGFVGESLLIKELLLSRRKHKHNAATYAKDIAVSKRHNPSSKRSRFREGSTGDSSPLCENWRRVRYLMPFAQENVCGT